MTQCHSKNNLDWVTSFLEGIGIKQYRIYDGGKEIMFSCPLPYHKNGDSRPSASYNVEKGTFHCFACGAKGTLPSLYKYVTGKDLSKIEYAEIQQQAVDLKIGKLINDLEGMKKSIYLEESVLNKYSSIPQSAYDYILKRVGDSKYIKEWELGYDPGQKRITMPVRDSQGNLVAVIGHNQSKVKYLPLLPKTGYKKLNYLYGMHKIDPSIDTAILVEGLFDVICGYALGYKNVYAIQGVELGDVQLQFLQMNFNNITVALDNDKSGFNGYNRMKNKLKKLFSHVTLYRYENGIKDFGDMLQVGGDKND